MNKATDHKQLATILQWYYMSGVDVIIADQPTDWFEISKHPAAPASIARQAPSNPPRASSPTVPKREVPAKGAKTAPKIARANHSLAAPKTELAVLEARELSAKANTIEELQTALRQFDGCSLRNMAKNTCFADGNPRSSLMLIGDAPGRDEDLAGRPFVGRDGQLLDKMLQAAKLCRHKDVWITNTVFWRPPGNRTPTQAETDICRPFLERQIELIKPQIIVALGGTSAKTLLRTRSGIMRLRGKWVELDINGESYQLLPILHPSYLLRTPAAKKLAWQDLLMIKEKLQVKQN
ncbi:MAG: uracil-DNA glycosylase [bacterium]|nr:uracil-DNA glycosylase [bacterium]